MSALQDILDKMYVDPELLEQLAEEQKQVLFIKMREEQLRRWRENEVKEEQSDLNKLQHGKRKNKGIEWLTGKDGEIWVWVMGDHPDDPTIDQILDKEAEETARHIAEKEVLMESLNLDENFLETNLDEQQLKNQLMEINLNANSLGQLQINGNSSTVDPHAEARQGINLFFAQKSNAVDSQQTKERVHSPYEEVGAATAAPNGDGNPVGLTSYQLKATRKSLPANFGNNSLANAQKNTNEHFAVNGLQVGNGKESRKESSRNHYDISPNTTTLVEKESAAKQEIKANNVSSSKEKPSEAVSSVPPPIPQRPANLRRSGVLSGRPMDEVVHFSRSYVPGLPPTTTTSTSMTSISTTTASTALPPFPVLISDNGSSNASRTGFNIGGEKVGRIAARLSVGAVSSSSSLNQQQNEMRSAPFYTSTKLKPEVSSTTFSSSSASVNNANGTRFSSSRPTTTNEAAQHYDNNPVPIDWKSVMSSEDPMVRLRSVLRQQQPLGQRQPSKRSLKFKQDSTRRQDSDLASARVRQLSVSDEIEKRQSKILEHIREQRGQRNHEAEVDEQKQSREWEEQERKSREAEAQIRLIAQKAREQHRKNLRTSASLLPVLNDSSCTSLREAM